MGYICLGTEYTNANSRFIFLFLISEIETSTSVVSNINDISICAWNIGNNEEVLESMFKDVWVIYTVDR